MDEAPGKTISWEEREKLKEKLAILKKEYHQTVRRLQRSQKAERVKTHVKKRIEEQNHLFSQRETEMGFTDSKPGAVLSLQAMAGGSDTDTQRKTAVTFNLEPEVFCIGDGLSTSSLPGSECDGQWSKCTADKMPERTPRSRLKLRRSQSTSRERAVGCQPSSCDVSLHQASLDDREPDVQGSGIAGFGGSSHPPNLSQMRVEACAPAQARAGAKSFRSQEGGLPGPRGNEDPQSSSQGHKIPPLADLSLASLESTPPLFISDTASSPKNRDTGEISAFVLAEEGFHEEGPYPSISNMSMGDRVSEHPGSAGSPSGTPCKPKIVEPRNPPHSDPTEEKLPELAGGETPGVMIGPECVPPAVAAESPLHSCTLVEGLLFPVEYYVRTTRRMSSCQRMVDLEAVIQSHLGTNKKGSRSKAKQLIANSDKVDLDTSNQEGLSKDAKLLLTNTTGGYVASQGTAEACVQVSRQSTSPASMSMTQIGMLNSHSERMGRGRPPGRGRGKAKSTRKQRMDVVWGLPAMDCSQTPKLPALSSPTPCQSREEHCMEAPDRVQDTRQAEDLLPVEGVDFGNSKERTEHVLNPPRRRNSSTVWKDLSSDDMEDFEMDLNLHRTPKRSAGCTESGMRTPRTPLHPTTHCLMVKEPSPQQHLLSSCLQRSRGKATSGWRRYSLKEAEEVSDSPGSTVLAPTARDSNFHTQDDRISWKMLPLTLDIQDFHLPDEEFGFLKLEKLKSCCVQPLEPFVCVLPEDRAQTDGLPSEGQIFERELDDRIETVGIPEKDLTERASEDQTPTVEPITQEEIAVREREDQSYTDKTSSVADCTVTKSEDQSYTGEAPSVGHITVMKSEDQSYTSAALVEGRMTFTNSEDHSCKGGAPVVRHMAGPESEDQSYTGGAPVVGPITVTESEDQSYTAGPVVAEQNGVEECSGQFHHDEGPIEEHVTEQETDQQLHTGVRKQTPTRERVLEECNATDKMQDDCDALILSGNALAELCTLEWQERVPPDQHRQQPSSSCLLSAPLGTALLGTFGWNGGPACTPAFPSLGPTPALCSSLYSAIPSSHPVQCRPSAAFCRPDPQTGRHFCSQKAAVPLGEQENNVLTGTLDSACLEMPIPLQGAWSATIEPKSEKRPLRLAAGQCETRDPYSQKRPLGSQAGQCETSEPNSQRPLSSDAGWCETREAHSQKRPLLSEAGQREASERHLQHACKRHEAHAETDMIAPFSVGVGGEESKLPGGDSKEGCHGEPKQKEAVEEPASVVLCAGTEGTRNGGLQLLSQIQAAGGGVSAVDLSTVWWDCAGRRELCTVTASESSISLWKTLDRGKWEIVHTWRPPEVPIMQLIPLPGQQNFVCVALGTLDIEEIWALFNSPESGGLSALLVKRGPILAARGLTRRRVASSSGTEPEQVVEVMSLSEAGRILETCVLWPTGETVLSFAEVEGERDALVGTTAADNAVIWNASSGALLKKIPMGHAQRVSLCLQAYSESGLLFIVLSHPHAQEGESSRRSVLSLIATNPKQGLSVHVMSYTLPEGCTGRYLEGDLKAHTAVAVLTTGIIALWDLHLGHCTALLPPSPRGAWSLVRWCQLDSHLLAGQKDGSVCVYKYSGT